MDIKFRRLKGTRDLMLEEIERWHWCEERWNEVLSRYGYGEIRTPVIEPAGLFLRSVGDGTDIVDKEMYSFESRGGEQLCLRPEMTASVVRAYLENGLTRQPGTVKFYYMAPMFRHDRPQAGRYRQFHQVGVEAIGSASPVLDAEVIQTAMALFDAVDARGLTVLVNSIGCPECKPGYVADLREFLEANMERIPPAFQERIAVNPLRLFDAKDDEVQNLLTEFKPITEALCPACRTHHAVVLGCLGDLGILFREEPGLVRGLDYYGRTTFEITAETGRKQSSLAGGGRYDGLIGQCGGPDTPAVGFSAGIERTLLHLADEVIDPQRSRQTQVDVYVACLDEPSQRFGLAACDLLRGFCRVEIDTTLRSMKAQAKTANLRRARILLTVGETERETGTLQLKNLDTGEQIPVERQRLLAAVREVLEG
ncbi:histidine--tRNA ligase [bacterium CG17_big_fil_post_rev_8_21_14_2_50_64_8]|nr:MAG: histidine--tRNA ligase [bacterium CG17_big_fil_post_rev_8_21_14_2_50_64_8]PJA74680.1 MAG: histidine--tRNA ligase [bacterium CG_4_9_14_3_um_filter_65_15]